MIESSGKHLVSGTVSKGLIGFYWGSSAMYILYICLVSIKSAHGSAPVIRGNARTPGPSCERSSRSDPPTIRRFLAFFKDP